MSDFLEQVRPILLYDGSLRVKVSGTYLVTCQALSDEEVTVSTSNGTTLRVVGLSTYACYLHFEKGDTTSWVGEAQVAMTRKSL